MVNVNLELLDLKTKNSCVYVTKHERLLNSLIFRRLIR